MSVRAGTRWIGYLGVALAALLGLGALAFTVLEMVDGGWGSVTEFGGVTLVFAWPTILALTFMIARPLVAVRWGRALGRGTAAFVAWVASVGLYSLTTGLGPLRAIAALAVWSGTPVIVVFLAQQALERAPFRQRTKVMAIGTVALVMVWCTAPTAIVIDCAMGAGCP